MRKKAPSQKLPCAKQNCCGASNEHENFLSVTSRGNTRSHSKNSKKKPKRAKKKDSAIKEILQQTYSHLRQQNQELQRKLALKKKKMEEMKIRIKECEDEIRRYQELERKWVEGQDYKSERQRKGSKEGHEEKNYAKIIQDSQNVAKETLERYKRLEEEYSKYRETMDKKMDKLRSQKQRLITQGTQKNYNRQIEQLKQELNRFRQDQITASSLKNLHSPSIHTEQKLKLQLTTLKAHNSTLKSQISQQKQYIKQLEQELEQRTQNAQHKERELRNNLDVINSKINGWEKDYRLLKEESMDWEQRYYGLMEKYQRRKQRARVNNAEWAEIFKEFIHEIDKLKQELDFVSERNVKLIKMYGHQ